MTEPKKTCILGHIKLGATTGKLEQCNILAFKFL